MGKGTVLSIGTFDGLHRGHRAILETVGALARERGLRSTVLAFETPPRYQITGGDTGTLLLPRWLKHDLLRQHADDVIPLSFADVRNLAPEEFVERLAGNYPPLRHIVEGRSFRFGKDRAGDLEVLASLAKDRGFEVAVVPPVCVEGHPVSSSRIRTALVQGNLGGATKMLGRAPVLIGDVVHGDGLGRTLGFPTANLAIDPEVLRPKPGVYLAQAFLDSGSSHGLFYVGGRPTLGLSESRCEAYLLSPPRDDLYGERMEIHLLEGIREDHTFPSLDALRAQMGRDVEHARTLIEDAAVTSEPLIP